jgi:flagellar hook-associated protein 1
MGISVPGFSGYYIAEDGILASQVALNVVDNNLSNANTTGYDDQSVNLEENTSGGGVEVSGINRAVDALADTQVQNQNSLVNFQSTVQNALQEIEGTFGDATSPTLDNDISNFYAAAQTLSTEPDNQAYGTDFLASAQQLLSDFQEEGSQLQNIQVGLMGNASDPSTVSSSQAGTLVQTINTNLAQVASLNSEIIQAPANSSAVDSLMDQRSQLLQTLSQELNITVETTSNNNVNIQLGNNYLVEGTTQSDSLTIVPNTGTTPSPSDTPAFIELASNGTNLNSTITGGQLGGIINVATGTTGGTTNIPSVLNSLNTLFTNIATQVNSLQAGGYDLSGNTPVSPNNVIFTPPTGGTGLALFGYTVNQNLIADPSLLAAASNSTGSFQGVGDGSNALAMANLSTTGQTSLGGQTPNEYFGNMLTSIGTSAQSATDNTNNLTAILQQLTQQQSSVEGVDMDQEMSNMLMYQRSYEASAKIMSVIDQAVSSVIDVISS